MGVMDEIVSSVLEGKFPHTSPPFYVRGVRENAYFYFCGHNGGCGRIGCKEISGGLGPVGKDLKYLQG